jgi:phospholipid/cholesterol/gamma-HCH transport system permease protein
MGQLIADILGVAGRVFRSLLRGRFPRAELTRQLYDFSVGSLGIVVLCVSFTGIIIILEYSHHMKMVLGNDTLIPGFAMVLLVRELAPAVTALLLTSKMGAGIAAELGAMKTTEQLDAYRLLGIDAVEHFVTPRFVASALSTLALSVISLFLATVGAWFAAVTALQFSTGTFFQSLFAFVGFRDFLLCAVKALCFGASIPVISATFGFRCKFGSEGVGLTTTDAVVTNSIWIIILDFLLTYLFSLFN